MGHVLMAFEPSSGWRRVSVSERRRKQEFAEEVRGLAEEDYPDAEKIRLVCDNLSTHSAAAFYETFPPEQARRLARRIEFVYTPVHGSWLNMVEIELSVLVRASASGGGAYRMSRRSDGRWRLGLRSATGWGQACSGASRPRTLARSCASSTRLLSLDGGLGEG